MNKRTTDVVAYLTWVGLLIAFIMGDRSASRFHLNQSLVIWLAATLFSWIPVVGWICWLFCAVCWFIGIINAACGVEREVQLVGHVHLIY